MRAIRTAMLTCFALIACAPDNLDELRKDPGTFTEFDTPISPEQAYSNEVRMFEKCMVSHMNADSRNISPSFDPDRRTGTIAWTVFGGSAYWGLVEIGPTTSGSHIRTYTAHWPDNPRFGQMVKDGASGGVPCDGPINRILSWPDKD